MTAVPAARSSRTLSPVPAVLLAVISVQGGAAVAKELFPALGAAGTSGLRISLAALVLLAVFRPSIRTLTRAQWLAVIPYGVLLGGMNLSFYLALQRIPLGLCVTVEFLGPLAVAVFGSRRASDFLWVLLAAVGIGLLVPWTRGEGALDLVGVLLALVAAACWAAYIVTGGRVSRLFSGGQGVAIGMTFAALTVLPVALAGGVVSRLTPGLFAAGLAVAVLSSALPYSLEMTALRVLPSRTFGILMSLEPAVAAIAGLLFLRERLSVVQWLAVLCVSAASAGSALTAPRAPPPVEA
ncbi:EamA family transporter [Corallococcus sp. H22C18031201]|uniref:EamA family transporter n=1 Tax=Citreicoccus inhibens TaxID=2849499 RepID=UPI000E72C65D|nr:DMT family transporter [Citreicoccus inhibens]MBU8896224.1 DMT family transporter [Citreicoccus inhibens]RJS26089.1 EamA family transporter [Corallococcus sp. H22C18031201]